MKRIVSLVLLICLFSCATSPAFAAFSLRNGYTWGMSKEDALALAKEEGLGENLSKGESVAGFENVMVGDFRAEMMLAFDASLNLDSIFYSFESLSSDEAKAMFPLIADALSAAYGESDQQTLPFFVRWTLSDTMISLYILKDYDNDDLYFCTLSYSSEVPVKNSGF